jgi:hypothetical protein
MLKQFAWTYKMSYGHLLITWYKSIIIGIPGKKTKVNKNDLIPHI